MLILQSVILTNIDQLCTLLLVFEQPFFLMVIASKLISLALSNYYFPASYVVYITNQKIA